MEKALGRVIELYGSGRWQNKEKAKKGQKEIVVRSFGRNHCGCRSGGSSFDHAHFRLVQVLMKYASAYARAWCKRDKVD